MDPLSMAVGAIVSAVLALAFFRQGIHYGRRTAELDALVRKFAARLAALEEDRHPGCRHDRRRAQLRNATPSNTSTVHNRGDRWIDNPSSTDSSTPGARP